MFQDNHPQERRKGFVGHLSSAAESISLTFPARLYKISGECRVQHSASLSTWRCQILPSELLGGSFSRWDVDSSLREPPRFLSRPRSRLQSLSELAVVERCPSLTCPQVLRAPIDT